MLYHMILGKMEDKLICFFVSQKVNKQKIEYNFVSTLYA
jgi:hypothetical protein